MVYCSSCGTANRDGSRFCNDCGADLPSGTSVRCLQCGTPNSPAETFCAKCGTRLVLTLADDAPESEPPAVPLKKGLSLPTKPDANASPPPADWLGQLRSSLDSSSENEPAEMPATDAVPASDQTDWLARLTDYAIDDGAPASSEGTTVPQPEVSPQSTAAPQPTVTAGEVPDWLTSLGIISGDNPPLASKPAEDVPEWLSLLPLDTTESAEKPGAPDASTEPSNPADWLISLRSTAPAESASSSDEDVPEWLRALGTGPLPLPRPDAGSRGSLVRPVSSAADDEEDIPEWLRTLGTGPLPSAAVEPTPSAHASPTEPENPADWLTNLRAAAPTPQTELAAAVPPAESLPADQPAAPGELPDWLRNLGTVDHTQRSTGELPDWLDSLGADAPAPEVPAAEAETPAEDDVPEWLRDLGASAVTPSDETAETALTIGEPADWMNALRATASQPVEPAELTSEPAADEVPDWLQAMGLPTSEPTPSPAADETPDWMSSLRAPAAQPVESAEPTSEPAADEVPDWLQAMGLPAPDQTPSPAADETPDWMSSLRATPSQSVESAEPTSEPAADEVPDWLRSFDKPVSRPVSEIPVSPSTADDIPDWLRDVSASAADQPATTVASEIPDWLQDTSAAPELEAASSIEPATELPDWLSNLQTPAAPTVSEPARSERPAVSPPAAPESETAAGRVEEASLDQTAVPAELPEWLKSLRQGKAAAPVQPLEPLPGLIQAEIPGWLEALRPQEGQAAAVADLQAESEQEGVFAGLSNVLPPMPGLDELPAPIPHEIIGPSADDLARAGIFQELLTRPISRPTAVAALTTPGKPAQRRLLQWAVSILLLAVVVVPFLMPQGWLPFLPHADNLPPSPLVQSAVTRIAILPPNASVLVVFDYDPTQAGEMNQIAEMLLRHLQTRAANITAVSLNPLGAGLARSVWDVMGTPTGGQRIDKGYVPGQAIGVQNVLLNNGPFDLVIDLSASSDSLRWWVEQLTVSGFNVPFIAGVSAAVESLALPYAQSGQITGLISGAAGAMMYARQANLLPTLDEVKLVRNQYHIESQTLAHWLLAILIVIGLVSGLVSRAGRRST